MASYSALNKTFDKRLPNFELRNFDAEFPWEVAKFAASEVCAIQCSRISNSLPINEAICSSVTIAWHGVHATKRAQSIMFYDQNKHGQSFETTVMSSAAFCGRIL